eukprot:13940450-Alexandrium_andersonii.AAC.1
MSACAHSGMCAYMNEHAQAHCERTCTERMRAQARKMCTGRTNTGTGLNPRRACSSISAWTSDLHGKDEGTSTQDEHRLRST